MDRLPHIQLKLEQPVQGYQTAFTMCSFSAFELVFEHFFSEGDVSEPLWPRSFPRDVNLIPVLPCLLDQRLIRAVTNVPPRP